MHPLLAILIYYQKIPFPGYSDRHCVEQDAERARTEWITEQITYLIQLCGPRGQGLHGCFEPAIMEWDEDGAQERNQSSFPPHNRGSSGHLKNILYFTAGANT